MKAKKEQQKTCPTCGACKDCGAPLQPIRYIPYTVEIPCARQHYPVLPILPQPYTPYLQPPYIITCGGTASSVADGSRNIGTSGDNVTVFGTIS